ncbi:MAG: hypothetical protein ACJAYU_001729 [Bradymonadia bacterium]|jgi:hypothetical protein
MTLIPRLVSFFAALALDKEVLWRTMSTEAWSKKVEPQDTCRRTLDSPYSTPPP